MLKWGNGEAINTTADVDPCIHIPRGPPWPVMGIPLPLLQMWSPADSTLTSRLVWSEQRPASPEVERYVQFSVIFLCLNYDVEHVIVLAGI